MTKQKLNITENDILFFDMDGTLVDTNFANFLSYKKAIQSFIQSESEIKFIPNKRFNRNTLKIVLPNLTETEYEDIIKKKEEIYNEYLPETKTNKMVVEILQKYSKTNKTVLVTNCRKERAMLTLNYHKLTDKFNYMFFRESFEKRKRLNKYKNAISSLRVSAKNIFVFEDERPEIEDAITAGISVNNIISF